MKCRLVYFKANEFRNDEEIKNLLKTRATILNLIYFNFTFYNNYLLIIIKIYIILAVENYLINYF